MKRVISIATAGVTAMLLVLTVSVAAQDFNKYDRTILTFSNAVELPGMRLEPGTYVFRIASTSGHNQNIVQVFSGDEKEMLGQWFYVPAERKEVSGDTIVTFRETSAGSTPAVQFWYYPAEIIGKEFIYPKDQAMRIASRTGVAVLTEEGRVTAEAQVSAQAEPQPSSVQAAAPAEAISEQGPVALDTSGIAYQNGDVPERTEVEAVGTTGVSDQAPVSSSVQQESTYAQSELPRTASPLPLSGLIALLSLAGAAGIRAFRR